MHKQLNSSNKERQVVIIQKALTYPFLSEEKFLLQAKLRDLRRINREMLELEILKMTQKTVPISLPNYRTLILFHIQLLQEGIIN